MDRSYNVQMCSFQGSNMKEVDDLVPGLEVIDWVSKDCATFF